MLMSILAKLQSYLPKCCLLALALSMSACDNEQLLRLPQLVDLVFGRDEPALVQKLLVPDPDIPHLSLTKGGNHKIIYPKDRSIRDHSFLDDEDGDPFMYDGIDWVHQGFFRRYTRQDAQYDVGIPDFAKSQGKRLYVNSLVRGLSVFDLEDDGSMTPVGEFQKDWSDSAKILAEDGFALVIDGLGAVWFNGVAPGTYPADRPRYGALRLMDTRSVDALGQVLEVKRWDVPGQIVSARRVDDRLYLVTYDGRRCEDCKSSPDGVEVHVFEAPSLEKMRKLATVPFVPGARRSNFGGLAKITQKRILISRVSYDSDAQDAEPRFELWSYALTDDPKDLRLSGPMITTRGVPRPWQVDEQGDEIRVVTTAPLYREPTVEVFSLASKSAPVLLGKVALEQSLAYMPHNVIFDEQRAYLTTKQRELQLVELAPATAPRLAAKFSAQQSGGIVVPDGDRLVVLGDAESLSQGQARATLWDVSVPDLPTLLSQINLPWEGGLPSWHEGLDEDKLLRYTTGGTGLWFPFAREQKVRPLEASGTSIDGQESCSEVEEVAGMAYLDWGQDQLKLGGEARFWDEARFTVLGGDELITVGLRGAMRYRIEDPAEPTLTASGSLYLQTRMLASAPDAQGPLFRLSYGARRNHVKVQMISRELLGSPNYLHEMEVALDDRTQGCPREFMSANLYVSGDRVHVLAWHAHDGLGADIITLAFDGASGFRFLGRTHLDAQQLMRGRGKTPDDLRLEQHGAIQKGRFLLMLNRLVEGQGASEILVVDLDASLPKIVERFKRPPAPYAGSLFESSAREVSSYFTEVDEEHPGELSFIWQRIRLEEDGRVLAMLTKVPGIPLAQSNDGLTGLVLGFSKAQVPESDPIKCFEQPYVFYYNESTQTCHGLLPQLHHVALLGEESFLLSSQPVDMDGYRLAYIYRSGRRVILTHLPSDPRRFNPVRLGEPAAPLLDGPVAETPATVSERFFDEEETRRHQLFSITDDFKVVPADLDPFLDTEDTRLRFEGPDQILRRVGWTDGDLLQITGEQELNISRRFEAVHDSCFPLELVGGTSLWCRGYWQGVYPYAGEDVDAFATAQSPLSP